MSSARKKTTKTARHTSQRTVQTTQVRTSLLQRVATGVKHLLVVSIGVAFILGSLYYFVLPEFFTLDSPRNLIIVSDDLAQSEAVVFVHISPVTEKIIVAVLKGTDKVEVLGGYGEYSIQAMYSLLQLDGKDEHFVRAALSHALGVMIDSVIVVPGLSQEEANSKRLSELLEPVVFQQDAQLDWRTRLELYFAAKNFRQNETRPNSAQDIAKSFGTHPLISEEVARACQVAVINTTTTPGLASGVAQLLEQSGAFVVRVASDAEQLPQTKLVVSDTAVDCEIVLEKIHQILPYPPTTEVSAAVPHQYRADIVVLAGEDIADTKRTE